MRPNLEAFTPSEKIDDGAELWICQGYPRCDLHGDAALKAQEQNCVWCTVKVMVEGRWVLMSCPVEA